MDEDEVIDYVTEEKFEKVTKLLLTRIKALENRVKELEKTQNESIEETSSSTSNMKFKFSKKDY